MPNAESDAATRRDSEHTPTAKTSVRHQDMAVEIESEEVAKGLDGNDGAGDGILLRHSLLKKELQGFPGASTQIGKKIPVPRSGRGQAPRKYRRRILGWPQGLLRWICRTHGLRRNPGGPFLIKSR